jgi:hypothetical protein
MALRFVSQPATKPRAWPDYGACVRREEINLGDPVTRGKPRAEYRLRREMGVNTHTQKRPAIGGTGFPYVATRLLPDSFHLTFRYVNELPTRLRGPARQAAFAVERFERYPRD